ncbi:MAG: HlyD family efflux transporter periplasmic adaptor subunit [Patescibacteria group bacterium]|jgi:RND family efflux transporter MFP subunit
MMLKISKFKIASLVAVVLVILGYGGYRWFGGGSAAGVKYATTAVERGTLVISVSGTGQIAAKDQVDLKAEVSGDLTGTYAVKDQQVRTGDLLFAFDSRTAQKSIRDAQVSLDDAQAKLDDMLAPPNAQTLLAAESAVAQAERDLSQAASDRVDAETIGVQALQTAYENAYDGTSTTLFKLADYLADLKDVLGNAQGEQEHVRSYRLILGSDSTLVQDTVDDYYAARDAFDETTAYFNGIKRDSPRDAIYGLIGQMVTTTDSVTQALESARRMYDAIVAHDYASLKIAATIDAMRPKIEADITAAYADLGALRDRRTAIDDAVKNAPKLISDADWSFRVATETLEAKRAALADLRDGYTAQEIRSQRNVVAQKEDALSAAREQVANYSIRAPFDGVIASVSDTAKKGSAVSSGAVLAVLVTPQKIATLTLNEIDIAKVKLGQKATVTFDAIEDLTMTGAVVEIDTLGTTTQGVVNYGVQVALDDQDERIKPGMSVSVAIVIDMRPDVLLAPNAAVKSSNGSRYVEILPGATEVGTVTSTAAPERRSVEIGLANDTSTEILSGLKEGDIIVTRTVTSAAAGAAGAASNQSRGGVRIPGVGGFGN